MNKALNNKVLSGHAFRNLTMKSIVECFFACLEDCLCMSFQMCENTECQLLSSNQFRSPSTLLAVMGCSYYDMVPNSVGLTNSASCTPGCRKNPCPNGTSYVTLTSTDYTTPRYKCLCSPGYAGNLCQYIVRSCRGYTNGNRVPGKYKVFDDNMNLFEVFCDFDLNSTMTWTLVQSYEQRVKLKFKFEPYSVDFPINQDSPRSDSYRLSKSRMQSIQDDSSKFRITCKYDTDGLVYRDYLQATKKKIDILTDILSDTHCPLVELIDVRGQSCSNCTAFLVQKNYILHSDSFNAANKGCQFRPTGVKRCTDPYTEDNFGYYGCINTAHRCSSSETATTQTWLGSN
ncbi:Versican core [Paramuricea clavata]|uniref:Versican core n=1 Tax=Paramuricea clavata TaxID=317549 RepID=A0A6S7JLX4_PARCT|nr:Versican core [Paramuricea clavata]